MNKIEATPLGEPLTHKVTQTDLLAGDLPEDAWIEVIQRMDEYYADLVNQQVLIEEKNTALEEAQQFIENVLSSMHDVLVVTDIRGNIQRVNRSLENFTRKPASDLLGQPLTVLFPAALVRQVNEFPEKIRSGELIDCEMDMVNAQQQAIPMAIACTPRYHQDGRLLGSVLTGKPLDEIRRAYRDLKKAHAELQATQQQLIQAEKMASLGRLVAGVAHELNNPISFVYGNMHVMKRYKGRFQRYLDAIHQGVGNTAREQLRKELRIDHMLGDLDSLVEGSLEGAERVSSIVQELKRFSAPKSHETTRFDLVQLLENSVQWVLKSSRMAPAIQRELPAHCPLYSHEGYVQQILLNLIQNALDALRGKPQPCLTLALEVDSQWVSLSIADNGEGIPEENLLKIFDPFFTTKPVGEGTGLGLYISYGLATEQCGGRLLAVNQSAGGAIFTLMLPHDTGGADV